jgi:hypothetical protein
MLSSSLLGDATHTMKRYAAGSDTRGGEIQCGYFDSAKNSNYSWTLYYLFKTNTAAQITQAVADGLDAPLGGWALPSPGYCAVSKTVYAYVDCNSPDGDTVAGAQAMLSAATSMAAPQASAATTTTTPNPARSATVAKIEGEVEFSTDGGKTFAPLTPSTKLKDGDFVSTGYESSVTLTFGHGTLNVFHLTQLRIDEAVDAENIEKTQTSLRIGLVTLRAGYMTTVGANKKATKPVKYTAAALKKITG